MGHRTLVAYRLTDGTFALHRAHWGRGLGSAIGPRTPFGGRPGTGGATGSADVTFPDPGAVGSGPDAVEPGSGRGDPGRATRVDPRPIGTRIDAEAVLARVDAALDSLVVASPLFETTTYVVCSLDPFPGRSADRASPTGEDTRDDSHLVVRPAGDPAALRAWFVERKSAVSTAVAAGRLSPAAARRRLRDGLAARGTPYSPDDASFLRAD